MPKPLQLRISKLDPNAVLPEKKRPGDVAWDISLPSEVMLESDVAKVVPLGFALALPDGYFAEWVGRSAFLDTKSNLEGVIASYQYQSMDEVRWRKFSNDDIVLGALRCYGTPIEASYRGEWKVCLRFFSNDLNILAVKIKPGVRIGGFVLRKKYDDSAELVEVADVMNEKTDRGQGGFGSSGVT